MSTYVPEVFQRIADARLGFLPLFAFYQVIAGDGCIQNTSPERKALGG